MIHDPDVNVKLLGVSAATLTNGNGSAPAAAVSDQGLSRYRWTALATVTLGTLMVFINQSIVLISLPDIFRGIQLNPLTPGNTGYLLWMLMGFSVVLAVLVVTLGRVGDIFGRVKIFNLGFIVFTAFSLLLAVTWLTGTPAALWLIGMRVGQGVGGAMLFANSSAIITDAFPSDQRGLGLGINNTAAIAGSFIGLVLGGVLAPVQWHLVFLISVPFGVLGTIVAYVKLKERGVRTPAKIDWLGNVTFAVGLILVLIGITYGLLPYGGHSMGWTNPKVLVEIFGGLAVLVVFGIVETRVKQPMFRLSLFRIRAFSAGNAASFLASLSRGGLTFMLIIWLQGIWLPLHGYSFSATPLWAGIYMIPLTVGLLAAAPLSGVLADRYGARPFATGGLVLSALTFILLTMLPVNFSYFGFAALIEQPAGEPARCRRRHGRHLQRIRPSPLHRDLFQPDDSGAGRDVAVLPVPRPHRAGGQPVGGDEGVASPPGREPLRRFPGLQPDAGSAGPRRAGATPAFDSDLSHQPSVLPPPDRTRLLQRADRSVLLRSRCVSPGSRGVASPGRQVSPRGRGEERAGCRLGPRPGGRGRD
jgi:MFS family permease